MTKSNLLILFLLGLTILACSSDDDCNDVLEPSGNEFTLNCNRFETPVGRLNLDRTSLPGTTSCKLQFANNHTGGDAFEYGEGHSDINFVDIWLIIPAEFSQLDEIPTGDYRLENNLNGEINEQYVAFDIANWNRVIFDGSVETSDNGSFFNSNRLYGSEFEDVIVNVTKNGPIYTIEYMMIYNGKTIKGTYVGELEVVDLWT